MDEEASDKLVGFKRHALVTNPLFDALVFPLEGDARLRERASAVDRRTCPRSGKPTSCRYGPTTMVRV